MGGVFESVIQGKRIQVVSSCWYFANIMERILKNSERHVDVGGVANRGMLRDHPFEFELLVMLLGRSWYLVMRYFGCGKLFGDLGKGCDQNLDCGWQEK